MMNKPSIMATRTKTASAPANPVLKERPTRATQAEPRRPTKARLPEERWRLRWRKLKHCFRRSRILKIKPAVDFMIDSHIVVR